MVGNGDGRVHDLRPSALVVRAPADAPILSFENAQKGFAASWRASSTDRPTSARRWSFRSVNSPSARRWRLRSIQTWIVVDSCVRNKGIRLARPKTVVRSLHRVGLANIPWCSDLPTAFQRGREAEKYE